MHESTKSPIQELKIPTILKKNTGDLLQKKP
jgi:hypothetical protein